MIRHEGLAIALTICLVGCGSDEITFGSGQGGATSSSAAQGGSTTTTTTGQGGQGLSCGNGSVEGNEACDGGDLAGQSCTDLGYQNPEGLSCTASCELDDGGCVAICDGGALEPGEDCDGDDLGNSDCTAFGFSNPEGLSCTESCALDPVGCKASCDGALLEPGELCDGNDLDGADCTMFGYATPAGLACSRSCELDATGCMAVCGNGMVEPDEDCDDMNTVGGDGCDANCQLEGTTCASAVAVSLAPGQSVTLTGDTTAGGAHASSQCQATNTSPDRVYQVTAGADGFLTVWLDRPSTSYDSVLYALADCLNPSSGIWCADAFDPASNNDTGGEVLSFEVSQGQSVYILVDGWNGSSGAYQIAFDLSEGTCADPVPFPIWPGVPMNALGSNNNKPNNTSTSTCGGGSSGEVIYEVMPEFSGALEARLLDSATNFDAVLSARLACNGTEVSCSHDGSGDEVVSLMVVDTSSYFVLVDGFTGSEGDYRLRFAP